MGQLAAVAQVETLNPAPPSPSALAALPPTVSVAGAVRAQVLHELHATQQGGNFGPDTAPALARRAVCFPGLPAGP